MEEEIWRDITGYEGLYQVSNLGNVKSVSRTIVYLGKNKSRVVSAPVKERILKQVSGVGGRLSVSLRKDGKTNIVLVADLVAQVFIENPSNLPFVYHKNKNLSDNVAENLIWSSEPDTVAKDNLFPNTETEKWRSVVGYEGLYEVSDKGRVRSVVRYKEYISKTTQQPSTLSFGGKYLKGSYNKDGYHVVSLSKNGITKTFGVHRLVALAFITNTENKPFVDHINTLPYDNRVDNLRWVDYCGNANNMLTVQHGREIGYNSQFRGGNSAASRAKAKKAVGVGVDTYNTDVRLTNYAKDGVFLRLLTPDGSKICDFGVSYDSLLRLKNEIDDYINKTKKTSLLM